MHGKIAIIVNQILRKKLLSVEIYPELETRKCKPGYDMAATELTYLRLKAV